MEKPSKYDLYKLYFRKEELIRTMLTKCEKHDCFLDGEAWIVAEKFDVNIH